MNIRRVSFVKTVVVLALPLTILAVPFVLARLHRSSVRQPRVNIVGKWRTTSGLDGQTKNHTYELFADGKYIEKCRREHLIGSPAQSEMVWCDEISYGHYELWPDNTLTLTTEKWLLNGRLESSGGYVSSRKLQDNGDEVVANEEHWRRITPWKIPAKGVEPSTSCF